MAGEAALKLAKCLDRELVACHVYAAEMHRARFAEMEIGLPERYQSEEKLGELRDTHEDIISGGMKMISDAYLAEFVSGAQREGLRVSTETPEGKNYVRFLEVHRRTEARLTVIGANGHGRTDETSLGSFAERVLLHSPGGDMLIMRRPWAMAGRPIVVGVDGSDLGYSALQTAVTLARAFGSSVKMVAVYDPYFHGGVFKSISSALTKEQTGKFDFAAQETLHDEIINDGLGNLYGGRLEKGLRLVSHEGVRVDKEVLTGKVFSKILEYATAVDAGMVVVGRFGLHREMPSLIGSTPHALARVLSTNLLIVGPTDSEQVGDKAPARQMTFAPPTRDDSPERSKLLDSNSGEADLVVLKKTKRMAPAFHEHIARSRIVGQQVEVGGKFLVFEIVETTPSGKVTVTPRTRLEFR